MPGHQRGADAVQEGQTGRRHPDASKIPGPLHDAPDEARDDEAGRAAAEPHRQHRVGVELVSTVPRHEERVAPAEDDVLHDADVEEVPQLRRGEDPDVVPRREELAPAVPDEPADADLRAVLRRQGLGKDQAEQHGLERQEQRANQHEQPQRAVDLPALVLPALLARLKAVLLAALIPAPRELVGEPSVAAVPQPQEAHAQTAPDGHAESGKHRHLGLDACDAAVFPLPLGLREEVPKHGLPDGPGQVPDERHHPPE
mmetsp:Transcript_50879/g.149943  ORF Transcript_50879/g.149943 Transcript_50879/m.149943 type:complete len:257 (-) Transcript_50879:529-1299(-)